MRLGFSVSLIAVVLACSAADPTTKAAERGRHAFISEFRASAYLKNAVRLQALEPNRRAAALCELAEDPQHGSEAYALCRMLFETDGNPHAYRPQIGGPWFIPIAVERTVEDWPLEPITLRDGIPILVVRGYVVAGGRGESPLSYVNRMLNNCEWSKTKYVEIDSERIKETIERFIEATPGLIDLDKKFLRRQAD